MDEIAWELEHSVEADVSPSFAWSFRMTSGTGTILPPHSHSTVHSPPVRGTTLLPGQEPFHWCIHDVRL